MICSWLDSFNLVLMCAGWKSGRKDLLTKAVSVPPDAETNEDFMEAVQRLRAGKSAFPLPFGKSEARKLVAALTIARFCAVRWRRLGIDHEALQWRADAKKTVAKWNSVASEFGIAPQSGALDAACRAMTQLQAFIQDTHELAFNYDAKLRDETEKVFGARAADTLLADTDKSIDQIRESLHAHVDRGRLSYAMNRLGEIVSKLNGRDGQVVDDIRSFLTEYLGEEDQEDAALHNLWLNLQRNWRG